jgi:hypothetical protein
MGGIRETNGAAAIAALPHVDEHAISVDAGAGETWEALLGVVERSFAGGATPRAARALGCEDAGASGPRPLAVGSAIPGFHVAVAEPPAELALLGRHRFSRYALIFRIDPLGPGSSRVRAETRAEFPGLKGAAYRALVIGSRGHVLLTRRLLAAVERRAERAAAA